MIIGIDTGGTYTDAVLFDEAAGEVASWAKSPTTPGDLSIGVGNAVRGLNLSPRQLERIRSVNLSTTLATNALVEERFRPVCLFLIGYDDKWKDFEPGERGKLGAERIVFIRGGHTFYGEEREPLDEGAIATTLERGGEGSVEAFAVSSLYGVRNPDHELRARAAIEKRTSLPVVCGHELASDLNAVARAATSALNAGLVPVIRELLESVRRVLEAAGLKGIPLMIMKGDGTLVHADSLWSRPIETILSGPAASVVGARWLARGSFEDEEAGTYVVDMGGTTTDLAFLRGSAPRLDEKGAQVARYRTMVKAVEIRTIGLGGDSAVRVISSRKIGIGPERFEPLSSLGGRFPETCVRKNTLPLFVYRLPKEATGLSPEETRLLESIGDEPVLFDEILEVNRSRITVEKLLHTLWHRGFICFSGFTPTDALRVLGGAPEGGGTPLAYEAAQELSRVMKTQNAEAFAKEVVEETQRMLAGLVACDALCRDRILEPPVGNLMESPLIRRLVADEEPGRRVALRANIPDRVVGIGAPIGAYWKKITAKLGADCTVPKLAHVASAVGVAISAPLLRKEILITPVPEKNLFRLYLSTGVEDFDTPDEAIERAGLAFTEQMLEAAKIAGIAKPQIVVSRRDETVRIDGRHEYYVKTTLLFEAKGAPEG